MYDNIIKTYELEHIRNKIKSIDITTKDRDTLLHIKLNTQKECCPFCYISNYVINEYVKSKITHSITLTRKTYIIFYRRI